MIDILDRVRNKSLHAKIVSAQEAAELIIYWCFCRTGTR